MTTIKSGNLLALQTGLFPDAETVELALAEFGGGRVVRERVDPATMSADDWDRLLQMILQAEKVVSL